MHTLASIECFVRSAEAGSFAGAARHLGLTPAAVGKNVARLEQGLGVRLFQRSTRSLTLTEPGERFFSEVRGGLSILRSAVANLASFEGQPAGTLKVTMGTVFGRDHVLPLLPAFLARYPAIVPDWHFDNRRADLIAEGFDAAIGGGFELPPGVVARKLAPVHRVLVASPGFLAAHPRISSPGDLLQLPGIAVRPPSTGRVRAWTLRSRAGEEVSVAPKLRMILSDPDASCRAAAMDLGVALVTKIHALPYLEDGSVLRVLPEWYADGGSLSIYYAAQSLLPAKTRAFVDFIVEAFRARRVAARLSAL